MNESRVGFAVIYRWRLHPGRERQFQLAWAKATPLIASHRSALGSRLHQAEDGTWVAYAQWPSKAAWLESRMLPPVDAESFRQMLEAASEAFDPVLLTPVIDLLDLNS